MEIKTFVPEKSDNGFWPRDFKGIAANPIYRVIPQGHTPFHD
jgi:hypothetical protein